MELKTLKASIAGKEYAYIPIICLNLLYLFKKCDNIYIFCLLCAGQTGESHLGSEVHDDDGDDGEYDDENDESEIEAEEYSNNDNNVEIETETETSDSEPDKDASGSNKLP